MATIDRRGDGYRVRWARLDGSRGSRACPDRRTAEALARDIESAKARGVDWQPDAPRATPLLVDVAEAYLRHVTRTRRAPTVANYTAALGRFLDYAGQAARVDVLTRQTLEAFYEGLVDRTDRRAGVVGEATRQSYVRQVATFWSWAYDREEYDGHVGRPRPVDLPALDATPTLAPTWAECDACIRELERRPAQGSPSVVAYRVAMLLRYTGLRGGQAAALRVDDVDLEAGTLRVRGELCKSAQERLGRIVPLAPPLVEELRLWGVQAGPLCGSSTASPASVAAMLRGAWERAGVRREVWAGRPEHAYRKAFISELRRRGAPTDAVEYLVGHSAGLRGVYVDPDALPLREAVGLVVRVDDGRAPPVNVIRLRAGKS